MSTPWKPPLQMGLLVACLYAGSFQQLLWPRATDRTSPSFFQPLQVVELPWRVYLKHVHLPLPNPLFVLLIAPHRMGEGSTALWARCTYPPPAPAASLSHSLTTHPPQCPLPGRFPCAIHAVKAAATAVPSMRLQGIVNPACNLQ